MSYSEFCLRSTRANLLLVPLCGIVNVSVTACPCVLAAPKIRAEGASHNFGQEEEWIEVSSNFRLHNDGDEPLQIYEDKSTCGCTKASLKRKVISARAVEMLKVVMDTSMKQVMVTKKISMCT